MKPAWSWQFEPANLGGAQLVHIPAPITREWAWGDASGRGVRVAVIDSGIDPGHPRIGPMAASVKVELNGQAVEDARVLPCPDEDLFGHGTACAGIIRVAAPECELYSVRVLGPRLTGKGAAFMAGLRWAVEEGMDVVNLSLGTSNRDHFAALHELVDDAYFRKIMVIAAVSNAPGLCYPSLYASVFSVASHERRDPFRFDFNPSPPVEFGAPGIDVDVVWRHGATTRVTGNSFAAPHITGLVARILSRHPGLTPFQMKTILHALADNAKEGDFPAASELVKRSLAQ